MKRMMMAAAVTALACACAFAGDTVAQFVTVRDGVVYPIGVFVQNPTNGAGMSGTYVQSLNGATGAVTLTAQDIGALTAEQDAAALSALAQYSATAGVSRVMVDSTAWFTFAPCTATLHRAETCWYFADTLVSIPSLPHPLASGTFGGGWVLSEYYLENTVTPTWGVWAVSDGYIYTDAESFTMSDGVGHTTNVVYGFHVTSDHYALPTQTQLDAKADKSTELTINGQSVTLGTGGSWTIPLGVSGAQMTNATGCMIMNLTNTMGVTTMRVDRVGGSTVTNFFSAAGMFRTGMTNAWMYGDDGWWQAGKAKPTPRYSVVGTGAATNRIRDNAYGLEWARNFDLAGWTTNFDAAVLVVSNMNVAAYGGVTGWRMPNVCELMSLINFRYEGPCVANAAGTGQHTSGSPFNNLKNEFYWSCTERVGATNTILTVYFNYAYFQPLSRDNKYRVSACRTP